MISYRACKTTGMNSTSLGVKQWYIILTSWDLVIHYLVSAVVSSEEKVLQWGPDNVLTPCVSQFTRRSWGCQLFIIIKSPSSSINDTWLKSQTYDPLGAPETTLRKHTASIINWNTLFHSIIYTTICFKLYFFIIQSKYSCLLDSSLRIFRIKTYINNNIASCAIWLWNMVSYIKGRTQAKGIWKQDPEANIWAQKGLKWGGDKAPQWGTS